MADCPLAASGPWVCNFEGRYVVIRASRFDHDRVSDVAWGGSGMSHIDIPRDSMATCATLSHIEWTRSVDFGGVVGDEHHERVR